MRRRPLRVVRPRARRGLVREPPDGAVLQASALDNAEPFYNVYGGTQDNNTLGGPSRTRTVHGIVNSDWFITTGGDGFQTRVDPEDPNIVYSESQNGGLVRYDKQNGEQIDIQPQPGPGEPRIALELGRPADRQPARRTRASTSPRRRLFRSDDRGDTWKPVSPDLTRQIDRNKLKVMGRVCSVDAVAKNASTSFYGNIVALVGEAPRRKGCSPPAPTTVSIQISEDGGNAWRETSTFPGVPDETLRLARASSRGTTPTTIYATFDNHKKGDFKPYVLEEQGHGPHVDVDRRRICPSAGPCTRSPRTR